MLHKKKARPETADEDTREFWVDLPTLLGRQTEKPTGTANGPVSTPLQREEASVPGEAGPLEPYGPSFAGQVPSEPPVGQRAPTGTALTQPPSATDPDGSWTGRPADIRETPVQDADDL